MENHWLIFFFTIAMSAFFSGMEIAFFSSNKLRIAIDNQRGGITGRVFSRFLNKPSELIATLLIGNNVALVFYGIVTALILEPFLNQIIPASAESDGLLLVLQTLIATFVILIFAEFLPKVVFRINANTILNVFGLPVVAFHYMFYPVVKLFILLSKFIMKIILGVKIQDEKYAFSTLDLDNYLIEFSQENEETETYMDEIQMIQNAMDFRTVKLRDCMIPRTEIVAVEIKDSLKNLNKTFIDSGHSKILIYKESIDNIIGYAHAYDLFKEPESLRSIIRSVIIVPESMLANKLMEKFIQARKSIAVVVDEFGGTAGIITMEDIIEEIFGDIKDEFDTEDLFERKLSDNEYIFDARHEIDYLNETYGFDLKTSDEYGTLAGFILHHHENIPSKDEVITILKFQFTVIDASETRLKRVKMKILE